MRADRRSAIKSHGLGVREALIQEWYNGREALKVDGVEGAARFKSGLGRHGDFERIFDRLPIGARSRPTAAALWVCRGAPKEARRLERLGGRRRQMGSLSPRHGAIAPWRRT